MPCGRGEGGCGDEGRCRLFKAVHVSKKGVHVAVNVTRAGTTYTAPAFSPTRDKGLSIFTQGGNSPWPRHGLLQGSGGWSGALVSQLLLLLLLLFLLLLLQNTTNTFALLLFKVGLVALSVVK